MDSKTKITVQTTLNVPVATAWNLWTLPEHITQWNNASPDWHTPTAQNDLRIGGKFVYRMETKDGSAGFDFDGIYDQVLTREFIAYTIADGRRVEVTFLADGASTTVVESFEAEKLNPAEMQRAGWQSILDNFRKYAEAFTQLKSKR
jgi:uncharacterized protein YndB with AHSA1/START domain